MKKFKLIKEYPGSPKLGTLALPYTDDRDRVIHYVVEHPKKDCDYLAIDKKLIEQFSEYWEEVVDIWYVVLLKDGAFRNAWEVIQVTEDPSVLEHKKYFKIREEAEEFILKHKPCLSLTEVQCILGSYVNSDMLVGYIKKNKL